MIYTEEQKTELIDSICNRIEDGMSLRKACIEENLPRKTFFEWIENNEVKRNQYARACEERAEAIADEIIDIADHTDEDHTPFTGGNVVQRDKARIDARKWLLGKLNPTKYGDKVFSESKVTIEQPLFGD